VVDSPISTSLSAINQPLIVAISTENYNLTTSEFSVSCLTCQKLISKLESARSNSNAGYRNDEIRKNATEAKQFSINKQANSLFWVVMKPVSGAIS
jgi:hypothetical protein